MTSEPSPSFSNATELITETHLISSFCCDRAVDHNSSPSSSVIYLCYDILRSAILITVPPQTIICRSMYWCDWGVDHKIEVANMDGDGRRILVNRGLYWPNGLTLDHANNWLYWVDAWYSTLEYYDLESHTITTLISSSSVLPHPFGLTLLEDHLYWTDWIRDAVYKAKRTTPSNVTVLANNLGQPMDIHAYDRNQTLPGNVDLKGALSHDLSLCNMENKFISISRHGTTRSFNSFFSYCLFVCCCCIDVVFHFFFFAF